MKERQSHEVCLLFLAEAHLTLFLMMFRLTLWKGRMKAAVASMWVGSVEGVIIISVWRLAQVRFGLLVPQSNWIALVALVIWFLVSDHYLVRRGYGIAFDRSFDKFSPKKKAVLLVLATGIIICSMASLYVATSVSDRVFNVKDCDHWVCGR